MYPPIKYLCLTTLKRFSFQTNRYFSLDSQRPLRILFYGSSSFSLPTLVKLNDTWKDGKIANLEVVCLKGLSPIQEFAENARLKVHTWKNVVPSDTFDLGVVVSFGQLIPSKHILACKYGMINAHPSILPRWRGAAPLIHTILNGDSVTGLTILEVAPKRFDVGKIYLQRLVPVPPRSTSISLHDLMAPMAADMVLEFLENVEGNLRQGRPQEGEVTHACKVDRSMGYVDWTCSVDAIDRHFRAFSNIIMVYTFWQGVRLKLYAMVDPAMGTQAQIPQLYPGLLHRPGQVIFHKKRKVIFVCCQDGWLGFKAVGLTGKKKMTAQEFYNGYLSKLPPEECLFDDGTYRSPAEAWKHRTLKEKS